MKITKAQALEYMRVFEAEVEQEQYRVAEKALKEGNRLLSQGLRYARGGFYAILADDIRRVRELIGVYGPKEAKVEQRKPPRPNSAEEG